MAKKKRPTKKHSFKHAAPSTSAPAAGPLAAQATTQPAKLTRVAAPTDSRDFGYVGRDLRRLMVFAGVLIGVEVVLWLLMDHTGLGTAVYNLVHV